MLGAMGLMYLWISLAEKKSIKEIMKVIVGGLVLFILLYYLLTPAMWGHPVEFIQYLIVNAKEFQRWLGIIRFNGCNYNFTDNPLPARYLPYMICLTTPVYILILSLIGHLDLLGKLIKEKADFFRKRDNIICVILVCLWILPLGYAVLKRVHVYNGWRHFYFVYAPLIIMAGMGLNALWSYSEQRNKLRKSLTVIVSLCMLWSMAGMVKNHPYQYAYFNFLAGKDVSEKYDMDYWNISVQNALEYILNVSEGTVHIAACDYNTWVGLNFTKDTVKDADRIVTDETYTYWYETSWQSADYVIINVSYSHMYDNEAHSFIRENYENVYTISSYGNPIMEIYRRT
jgi:hypothetical protein